MPGTKQDAKRAYHHGDLRKALVEAAIALIDEDGVEALTLRAVAARAGVSHAAPQHHFPTLGALLTAIAALAFERLAAATGAAVVAAGPSPAAGAAAHGRAYLAFARRHPGLFRLMFTSRRLDWTDAALVAAGKRAYGQLEAVARPLADALGAATAVERTAVEQLIWSSAHGFAHLVIEGMIPKPGQPPPADVPDVAGLLIAAPARRRSRLSRRRPPRGAG